MLTELRDARAVKAVLGREAHIVAWRELQRRRNRRSLVVELEDGSQRMLKWYRRAELAPAEAQRLAVANALEGVASPRLCGSTRHHLVQEFVAGEPLDRLGRRTTPEGRVALSARAAGVLAAIHGAKHAPLLAETCAPRALAARLVKAWRLVEGPGLARWEALHGAPPAGWRASLDEARLASLAAQLGATGAHCVLGHGDFHLRHVVCTPDDRLCVVDWSAMALVSPWLELSELLRWHAPEGRAVVTQAYLEAVQRRGSLCELSPAAARSLAESALVVTRLLVAKRMVRKLRPNAKPSHVEAFRVNLDALAERA